MGKNNPVLATIGAITMLFSLLIAIALLGWTFAFIGGWRVPLFSFGMSLIPFIFGLFIYLVAKRK
jgi:hypothetical protein